MYTYNIYLNSPLLACNLNRKKYYINIINKNNKIINKKFELYKPEYYYTSYSRIYNPSKIIIPN
jgi:hypothetical protein